MTSRRKFLQQSGTFALSALLFPQLGRTTNYKSSIPIGLQLYTLGDLMVTDPKGTLQKLAAIGFKEVESAASEKGSFYGFTPKEFSAMVKAAGMHWRSAHVIGAPFTIIIPGGYS